MNKRKWERRSVKLQKEEKERDKLAYPLTPDRTSIETHYRRSKKIRGLIYGSLVEFSLKKRSFADLSDLSNQVANDAKCSYETATRWIKQYTSFNGDFQIFENETRIAYKLEGEK